MPGSGWMAPFTKGTWQYRLLLKLCLLQHGFRKPFKSHWHPVSGTTGQQRASKQLRLWGGVMRCLEAVQMESQDLAGGP